MIVCESKNQMLSNQVSFERFLDVDRDVLATSSPTTDAEILAEVMAATETNENEEESSDDDDICNPPTRPSKGELEDALDVISNSSFYSVKYGEEIQSLVLKLQSLFRSDELHNRKQQQIIDYFGNIWIDMF